MENDGKGSKYVVQGKNSDAVVGAVAIDSSLALATVMQPSAYYYVCLDREVFGFEETLDSDSWWSTYPVTHTRIVSGTDLSM